MKKGYFFIIQQIEQEVSSKFSPTSLLDTVLLSDCKQRRSCAATAFKGTNDNGRESLTLESSHVLHGSEADAGDIEAADRKLESKRLVE